MKTTPNHAIVTQLLMQAAAGLEAVPGLHRALQEATPLPACLPARRLSREEFLAAYVVPWLAGRVRAGEPLDTVAQAYQQYATPARAVGARADHLMIEQGVMAVEFGPLRDALRHDDEALCAVMLVASAAGANGITIHAERYSDSDFALRLLLTDVLQVAAHLGTVGPLLFPQWPRTDPIRVNRVIDHLHMVSRMLVADHAEIVATGNAHQTAPIGGRRK